jgi:hypothetical protein
MLRPVVGNPCLDDEGYSCRLGSHLTASELESKMMALLRGLKECGKLKGIRLVHVGSLGQEWLGSMGPGIQEA